MTIREFLEEYKCKFCGTRPNQYNTNPIPLTLNMQNVEKFNSILRYLRTTDLNTISRTPSGGIGKGKHHRGNGYAWDLQRNSNGARITIIVDGDIYVFKLGAFTKAEHHTGIYPNQAFRLFKEKCLENGIDLDKYKIDNGKEIKETIESPLIQMKYRMTIDDEPLDNCHHIDFHNSFPAGLCNTHPEFRKVIEPIYEQRKDPKYTVINKAILNYTIGWMQSYKPECNRHAEWAILARDAIWDNNFRVVELAKKIQVAGREIIGFNTDGIWYRGDIYHGSGEGDKLGEWHNDYINCIFRSKSNGAYEFIENGIYIPKLRGCSTYDRVEPNRKKWKFGDIYNGYTFGFRYNEIEGEFEYEEI